MTDDYKEPDDQAVFVNEEEDQYGTNADQGYVLQARGFPGSSTWEQGPVVALLAVYLWSKAVWKKEGTKRYCRFTKREILLQRGDIMVTIGQLKDSMHYFSYRQIRLALDKLLEMEFCKDITPELAKKGKGYFLLRVKKYGFYQDAASYNVNRREIERKSNVNRTEKDVEFVERARGLSIKTLNINTQDKTLGREDNRFLEKASLFETQSPELFPEPTNGNGNGHKPRNQKITYTDDFVNRFWNPYPFKYSKCEAFKAWNKISTTDRDAACARIPTFPFDQKAQLYPATYLNNRRWEDEGQAYDKTKDPHSNACIGDFSEGAAARKGRRW